MRCAKCKSTDVQKFENVMRGFCPSCGGLVDIEYEDTQEKQSMQIFFSYGHDTHQDFVRRLANAIMRKTDGRIKVWIDNEDIHEHTNWRERITDGILNSRSVLAFLSQYSAREKGVCLDELAIALSSKHGMIKTVLLEKANTFTPPALVTEYQWADMSNYKEFADKGEEAFAEYVDMQAERVIAMLDSDEVTKYNNELSLLRKKLGLPEISYEQPRLNRLLKTEMVGRTWLTDMVNAWIEDKTAKPVLMLYGKPGAGKSMFSAHLQHYNPHVAAAFACNHQSDEFSNTDNIITWLAYKLAMRLPDFRRQVLKLFEDPYFDIGSKKDRFDRLIAHPLSLCIDGNRAPMMIIIDALDEAKGDEMAGFISEYSQLLPPWLRMLITARKEPHITERFKNYPHIDFDEQSENNEADIRAYYEVHLHDLLDRQPDREAALQRLLAASEGVFLYAEEICPILNEEVAKGNLDLLTFDLPQGMDSLFRFSMKRKDFTYHKDGMTYHYTDFWQEPLGMTVAALSPLPVETLKKLMNWNENDYHSFRLPLSALLTETDGCLQTFHRSFGEWLNKTGEFHSSTQDGLVNLAKRSYAVYQTGVDSMDEYLLCNLTALLRKAKLQNEYAIAVADNDLLEAMKKTAAETLAQCKYDSASQLSFELVCIFENGTSERDLFNYAVALVLLGRVTECRNQFDEAAQFFEKSYAVAQKLTAEHPDQLAYQKQLSVACLKTADILRHCNDAQAALEKYAEALSIIRQLSETAPDNVQYQAELVRCLNRSASVLIMLYRQAEALEMLAQALQICRKLVELQPEKAEFQQDLYFTINQMADLFYAQDKYDEALSWLTQSAQICRHLVRFFPENLQYQCDLAVLFGKMAGVCADREQYEEALRWHEEELKIKKQLAEKYPDHPQFQHNLSVVLINLAKAMLPLNKTDFVDQLLEKAIDICRHMVLTYPENALYCQNLSLALYNASEIMKEKNRSEEAKTFLEEAIAIHEELCKKYPQNMQYVEELVSHYVAYIAAYENIVYALKCLFLAKQHPDLPRCAKILQESGA